MIAILVAKLSLRQRPKIQYLVFGSFEIEVLLTQLAQRSIGRAEWHLHAVAIRTIFALLTGKPWDGKVDAARQADGARRILARWILTGRILAWRILTRRILPARIRRRIRGGRIGAGSLRAGCGGRQQRQENKSKVSGQSEPPGAIIRQYA